MRDSVSRLSHFLKRLKPLLAKTERRSPLPNVERLSRFFDTLSPLLEEKTSEGRSEDFWHVMGFGRNEVQTARVLAWLLDPAGSHGFRTSVLDALWSDLPADIRPFPLSPARRVQREAIPLGNGENRVDIEILGADFLLIIEVKIDAPDQPNQLARYAEIARRKAQFRDLQHHCVLYLTCRPKPASVEHVVNITWADVAGAIERASLERPGAALGTQLALSFSNHIRGL